MAHSYEKLDIRPFMVYNSGVAQEFHHSFFKETD